MGNKANNKPASAPVAAAPVATATATTPTVAVPATLPAALPQFVINRPAAAPRTRTGNAGGSANVLSKSTVANPVQAAFALFAQLHTANPGISRSAVVAAGQAAGIAYYTVRTQYQIYRKALKAQQAATQQAAQA